MAAEKAALSPSTSPRRAVCTVPRCVFSSCMLLCQTCPHAACAPWPSPRPANSRRRQASIAHRRVEAGPCRFFAGPDATVCAAAIPTSPYYPPRNHCGYAAQTSWDATQFAEPAISARTYHHHTSLGTSGLSTARLTLCICTFTSRASAFSIVLRRSTACRGVVQHQSQLQASLTKHRVLSEERAPQRRIPHHCPASASRVASLFPPPTTFATLCHTAAVCCRPSERPTFAPLAPHSSHFTRFACFGSFWRTATTVRFL
ncbi:hypothetical protein BU26DRAFT_232134 [Trematosphaeria pertusa]|uniref:Uncharacterized protein n=1 Tax=Trematosphaeria pertusa TaxID=390896 RepID=A0A6A6IVI7_9PLEO|nr:uncharacterized protein BU26DRAFT_232134 [Trematosphaeria pertusa]KAF2253932.1 hypothetical protein BU26DRAFT_232134 [Trematosphaeria pertusa]